MIFNRDDHVLPEQFNIFLKEIQRNGVYDEILDRWLNSTKDTRLPDLPENGRNGVLRIGVTGIIEPFNFIQNRELVGIDIELAKRFAASIGKKPEIKYRATPQKQEEIVMLQRMILDKAAKYVKPDGTLIFSTCTIAREENEENVLWFLKNYPYRLESLDPYIPEELHCKSTKLGYLQLLPGIHKTDGFFIARFRRK